MKEFLVEIWPYIENIGLPILAIIGGISFFSINFYFQGISELRHMDEYFSKKKTIKGFKSKNIYFIGVFDIIYCFRNLNKLDFDLVKFKRVKAQISYVKMYRNYYKYAFPIIILLIVIGVIINETIIK